MVSWVCTCIKAYIVHFKYVRQLYLNKAVKNVNKSPRKYKIHNLALTVSFTWRCTIHLAEVNRGLLSSWTLKVFPGFPWEAGRAWLRDSPLRALPPGWTCGEAEGMAFSRSGLYSNLEDSNRYSETRPAAQTRVSPGGDKVLPPSSSLTCFALLDCSLGVSWSWTIVGG